MSKTQQATFQISTRSGMIGGVPRLAFDSAGEGELVILLHGVGGNRSNWSRQLSAFAAHFRVLALDARGYGDSDDYNGSLQFSDYADDVIRVLDHCQARRAHIVGLSMGGNVAMDFAVRYSSRVHSLVLCDTDRGMTHLPEEERQRFLALRRDPLLAGMNIADITPAVVASLIGPNASDEVKSILTESMLRVHKTSYMKSVEATVNFNFMDLIKRIAQRTLVVVGEFDTLTPVSEAEQICAEIAGASLVVIADAGHLSNVEQPHVFNREVLRFLLQSRENSSV